MLYKLKICWLKARVLQVLMAWVESKKMKGPAAASPRASWYGMLSNLDAMVVFSYSSTENTRANPFQDSESKCEQVDVEL